TELPMAAIEQLTPLVQRIVVAKGGPYSRFAANAYVVGTGARATLVDTGTGDASSLEAALSQLRASNRVIADVVLTHAHGGHANGLMLLRKHGFEGSAEKVAGNPRGELRFVADGDSFTAADGSTAFKVFHTPGHSEDSICLLLQQEQLLFSGDAISSLPTPSIHTLIENLDQYTSSLKRLTALGPRIILPGHGPVITDGLSYLAE
ncbi:beta-lactamase-like protein, partial [Chytriomyces sp. MP71]